jgi:hypothetical protein
MLKPDGKIQGVFVASGVKTLTNEVTVGSDVEVGNDVFRGCGVGPRVAVAAPPEKVGVAGPQQASRITALKPNNNFSSSEFHIPARPKGCTDRVLPSCRPLVKNPVHIHSIGSIKRGFLHRV